MMAEAFNLTLFDREWKSKKKKKKRKKDILIALFEIDFTKFQ